MVILVNHIRWNFDADLQEAFGTAVKKLRAFGIHADASACYLYKRSVDARKKEDIHFVCTIAVKVPVSVKTADALPKSDFSVMSESDMTTFVTYGDVLLSERPVIVGSGPCGLFCALLLAKNGYKPVVLERGGTVEQRKDAVAAFCLERVLDKDTNIQFGAGGAGTFSDGKLITRIGDPLTANVLKTFVAYGAPAEIEFMAKPHIGTDILSKVVENMIADIERLGGDFRFHTKFEKMICSSSRVTGVQTSGGHIPCGALVLAVGHSARDTYAELMSAGLPIEAKPFSVGMRIEHLTKDIDEAMYGTMVGHAGLGHAEYALSYNTKVRGVYTFCMCPGGVVVPAASEENSVVVNGMSEHKRDGKNSNSAVVCSIFKEDYGATPMGAIQFQRKIEQAAFLAGGSDYSVPLTTVGDFLKDEIHTEPKRVLPTYMDGNHAFRLAKPEMYLPSIVCRSIRAGLLDFDKKIHGFAVSDAILSGAETRTSAPIRILRDSETHLCLGYGNLYPAGEGAGYAGGITSAAVDGLRTAVALMKQFSPHSLIC